ncbi:MAG: NAD(P)-binding protein [Alphaproteobacteria bacterium]|nr:NAD(P)-binding protein [Alphaproteobacteria bacterium]
MTKHPVTAIIGAGVAGLALGRSLAASGQAVVLFDKARGPGGRAATRRVDGVTFDHGAPGLEDRPPAIATLLAELTATGAVQRWIGPGLPAPAAWTGAPTMSALPKALAAGLDVRCGVRITTLETIDAGWLLHEEGGAAHGPFARTVVAVPAPQAVPLLSVDPALAEAAARAEMAPRWTTMLALDQPLPVAGLVVGSPTVELAIRMSTKPGRAESPDAWVLHASQDWTVAHLEDDAETVAQSMIDGLLTPIGGTQGAILHAKAHRWRYAIATKPLGVPYLLSDSGTLAACGDWCAGPRLGDAMASGLALAARLLDSP